MKIRRVVTGHDAEGKARVVDDGEVEPITSELMPGCAAYRLWGRDERPVFPDDGAPLGAETWYPPRDGSRFMVNVIPPGELVAPPGLDTAAAMADLEREMPGAIAAMDPDVPGMHTTDSLDYVVVLAGEITLDLGDGEQAVVRTGDVVVQNGTRHAWRNHGTGPCTIVGVAVGADRSQAAKNARTASITRSTSSSVRSGKSGSDNSCA